MEESKNKIPQNFEEKKKNKTMCVKKEILKNS